MRLESPRLIALLSIGLCSAACVAALQPQPGLARLKAEHPTKLRVYGPSPQAYQREPPDGAEEVSYRSGSLRLKAWLLRPKTGGKHGAVLYAHHGFALSQSDLEDARAFCDAGFVTLLPAWRGENGNPGQFERYFGEVEDASAALTYLSHLKGVDGGRLYAAGDTIGGTTALLLAESGAPLRMAASCSAFPDINEAIASGLKPQYRLFPYDWSVAMENDLRSPGKHLADLVCPVVMYNSDADPLYLRQTRKLPAEAASYGRVVGSVEIPHTTQTSVVRPAIESMVVEFVRDMNRSAESHSR